MSGVEQLEKFYKAVAEPYAAAKSWKDLHHGKIIGHLLPDVPEELIHASGAFPIPVMTAPHLASQSYTRLPAFTCAVLTGPMARALDGTLNFIDGMVIPYVCDSTRAFSHVWELNFKNLFNYTLWVPKRTAGSRPKEFLYQEFTRMKRALENFLGKDIEERELNQSIEIYNRNRELLRGLYHLKKDGFSLITNANYAVSVEASMLMDKNEHSKLLAEFLTMLDVRHGEKSVENRKPIRIFLFGSICDNFAIWRHLDEVGLHVFDDNLYNGTRYFSMDVPAGDDPIRRLVERHFLRDPLSCYHYTETERKDSLLARIREGNIDGVLFLNVKYCEPLAFDYPMIKELLEKISVPLLFLETDFSAVSLAQAQTRIEAFAEMLREKKHGSI
jgi:benzoyl-CoA reductase subunit C